MSNTLRITGMASGMDTDTTIKQMMKPYNARLDKMKQDKQVVQWRQDAYRDIMGSINGLKNTFLDYTKPASNMLSKNTYTCFDVSTDPKGDVSMTAGASVVGGNYTVEVSKLAAGAKVGGAALPISGVKNDTALSTLSISDSTISITANGGTPIDIGVKATDTIDGLVKKINDASGGGFLAKFSELTQAFVIETKKSGVGATLSIGGDANTIAKLGLGSVTAAQNAEVKITPPGGTAVTVTDKQTNNFTIDGITYNLQNTNIGSPVLISVNKNVQKSVDKIKEFVTKYNEVIDNITKKIGEKTQRTYLPLTDDQKTDMKQDEIDKWEEKAKEGIVRNDDILKKFTSDMRSTLYKSVPGAGISLSDKIGLGTSSDPTMGGKLILDESKLKEALEKDGDSIINLFANTSTTYPAYTRTLTFAQKQTRISEEGIFQRISDVIQEYTSTYRDSNSKKGMMIEKAGIKGDLSDINNILYKDLQSRQKKISEMQTKLTDKESAFYLQFSKLETAMQKYNSQSSWMTQQMGGA